MNNLVTVSIASYNNALYIERCLVSVINQTYHHIEVLVIDDGSKDNTQELIDKYKSDPRVRIIIKENGGLSSVRQRALEEARGDYICFIDADDYLKPDYVRTMLEKTVQCNADVCICGVRFEDLEGNYIRKDSEIFSFEDSEAPFKLTHELYSNTTICYRRRFALSDSWNKLYSVLFLRNANVRFVLPKGYNGTDSVFNQKVALHEPSYVTVSYEGYIHVIYKKSAVHRRNKRLQEGFFIQMDQLIEDCIKQGVFDLMKERLGEIYYSYQIAAFEDVYNERITMSENYKIEFENMQKAHEIYIESRSFLKYVKLKSRSLKLFCFFVNNTPFLISAYFDLRNRRR